MNYQRFINWFYVLILGLTASTGCKKENQFLNEKPQTSLEIPKSLNDLQQLLHDEAVFNAFYPVLGELGSDDYYVSDSRWTNGNDFERGAYIWDKALSDPNNLDHAWLNSYNQVYYANTVLDYLPKISYASAQQTLYNQIKGCALFFRSLAFYNLVQVYALPYDTKSSQTDPGIPLRLTSDLNAKSTRAPVQQCYNQILTDLQTSASLLNDLSTDITVPSRSAAYGLLSRVYLAVGDYPNSLLCAKNALAIKSTLQDFNKLDPNAFPVYPNFSPEELFHGAFEGSSLVGFQSQVDSTIYKDFSDPNDLRPSIYFYNDNGMIEFNSQFDRNNNISSAIATDELFLNKAECEARSGDFQQAMADLNVLLITRWKAGTYKPFTAVNADDALNTILTERRKELLFTGLRWTDLRRLNKDPRFAITLYRKINGTLYSLPPNDPRYAYPLPDNEIQLTGEPQNLR